MPTLPTTPIDLLGQEIILFKSSGLDETDIQRLLNAFNALPSKEKAHVKIAIYSIIKECLKKKPAAKMSLVNWKKRAFSFINQNVLTIRKSLLYRNEYRLLKTELLEIRRDIASSASFDEIRRFIRNGIKITEGVGLFLYEQAEIEFFTVNLTPIAQATIISEYIDTSVIVCIHNCTQYPTLIKEVSALLTTLKIPYLITKKTSDKIWLRDQYLAYKIQDGSGFYSHWQTPPDKDSIDERYMTELAARKNSALHTRIPDLRITYDITKCSLINTLNPEKKLNKDFLLQGGNLMVTERTDGSRVVIIGENSLLQTILQYEINKELSLNMEGFNLDTKIPENHTGSSEAYLVKRRYAKIKLRKLLGLSENDDLCIIPDAGFHIDTFLFSPKPGLIILNNIKSIGSVLSKAPLEVPKNSLRRSQKNYSQHGKKIDAIYRIIEQKLCSKRLRIITTCLSGIYLFNLANGLSIKTQNGQHHFLVAKSYFLFLEDTLRQRLAQEGITLHVLGDANENCFLNDSKGGLRCISTVMPPSALKNSAAIISKVSQAS